MEADSIEEFAKLIAAHIAGSGGELKDSFLDEAAKLILLDLPLDQRRAVRANSAGYMVFLQAVIARRSSSTYFRRQVMRCLGKSMSEKSDTVRKIFLSYRRSDSLYFVQRLAKELKARPGFAVFLDQTSLNLGSFPKQLKAAVRASDAFVLVLVPGTLERAMYPDDFVRIEIETAIQAKRLIVPLLLDHCPFPSANELPESLHAMQSFQSFGFDTARFEESLDRLERQIGTVLSAERRRR